MYSMAGHQAATIQAIGSAPNRDGRLNGIRRESVSPRSRFDNYIEPAAIGSRDVWGCGRRHLDKPLDAGREPQRACGDARRWRRKPIRTGMRDGRARYATGIDPVQLRLRNDTTSTR